MSNEVETKKKTTYTYSTRISLTAVVGTKRSRRQYLAVWFALCAGVAGCIYKRRCGGLGVAVYVLERTTSKQVTKS